MRDHQRLSGTGMPGSIGTAATALSPGRNASVQAGCVAQSKAAADKPLQVNPAPRSSTVDSDRCRGNLAAALPKVRCSPSMIIGNLESIKGLFLWELYTLLPRKINYT